MTLQTALNIVIPFKSVKELFTKYDELNPIGAMTVEQLLKRSNINLRILNEELKLFDRIPSSVLDYATVEVKYQGYLVREASRIAEAKRCENTLLSRDLDYTKITALRKEASVKLNQIKPQSIAQASRISGVTPADINVLLVYLKKNPSTLN